MFSEKVLERKLKRAIENLGGKCLKYSNNSETGFPDRIILLGGGVTAWAEIKSEGKKPSPMQKHRIKQLSKLGFLTGTISSDEELFHFLRDLDKIR